MAKRQITKLPTKGELFMSKGLKAALIVLIIFVQALIFQLFRLGALPTGLVAFLSLFLIRKIIKQ